MSGIRPQWRKVRRYLRKYGFEFASHGGEVIIIAPKDWPGGVQGQKRQTVRIGHTCCNSANAIVKAGYMSLIKRAFGVTPQEIRDDVRPACLDG